MTTLLRPPLYLNAHARAAMREAGDYLDQQLRLNDPLSRFGPRVFGVHLDFLDDRDTTGLTAVTDGSTGSNTFSDAVGGVYNVVTAAADNDYHALSSDNEVFKFASAKPLWFEIAVKHTQGDTSNDAAFWFGLTDTLTTGGFQANAAGPLASYDGALWWKDEDGTTLNFECSNAGTQDTESAIVTWPDDTWVRLGFYFDGSPTTSRITPYYNVSGDLFAPLVKGPDTTITLSGLEEMHFVFGVKAGPGGGAETLSVDWIDCFQVR